MRWPAGDDEDGRDEGGGGDMGGEGGGEDRSQPRAAGLPWRWPSAFPVLPSVMSTKPLCKASPALKACLSVAPNSASAAWVTSSKAFAALDGLMRLAICWTPKSDMAQENLSMDWVKSDMIPLLGCG
ncbi:MAG TPA: hypothetical protein VKK31_14245 [Thermoanaerobaculia bacterium]|nr:hypothetical protein [Thermoanaerobaculia bacterium]